jgi:AraC family transcriptional regulator
MENVFTIQIPEIFCAKFKYHGDLLKISDTFVSDYGKFLKLSKRKTQGHDIELIQVFNADGRFMENYDIFVPIEKTEDELEDF